MFSDRGNLLANSRITCTDFDRKGGGLAADFAEEGNVPYSRSLSRSIDCV